MNIIEIMFLLHRRVPALTFIDTFINLITTVIALVIGLYAYKGYILLNEKRLLHINLSFTIIGAGILVEAILNFIAIISRSPGSFIIGESVSVLAQIVGYVILIYAYYRPVIRHNVEALLLALVIFGSNRVSRVLYGYLLLAIIIIFVLYKLALNLMIKRDVGSLLSFLSFAILESSYLILTLSLYNIRLYLIGEFFRMMGFLILALLLYITSRGAERKL